MAATSKQLIVNLCKMKADMEADISHRHQTKNLQPFDLMLSVKL